MWPILLTTILTGAFGTFLYLITKWTSPNRRRIVSEKEYLSRQRAIEQKDAPGVYRSGILVDTDVPVSQYDPEVATLYDVFIKGLQKSGNGRCLGYRPAPKQPYCFLSYEDVLTQSRDFGSALITKVLLEPGDETRVGIYAKNCPQWFIAAFGCTQQSITIVPLYDTLGPDAITYIMRQTEMSTIVIDTVAKAEKVAMKHDEFPSLKTIIIIEENDIEQLKATYNNIRIFTFNELVEEGHKNPTSTNLPKPNDTYIICYTSGTTGFPKGVILSHRNFVSNVSAFYLVLSKFALQYLSPNEILISYLPLSHTFEQMSHWCTFMLGASTAYYSGNIQTLLDDLKDLQPTIFPVVPRLLNRFYDLIQANLKKSNPVVRALYNYAYEKKLALLKRGITCNDTIWDKLVFHKIQAQIGGRVHLMPTGSAPVSAEVLEACRVAFGAMIIEGYGQTECTGLVTTTWPCDFVGGNCGGPATCTLLKLADVPEMQYYASDGKGEIMVKGPHCTVGYFRDPEKTLELFDSEGFIHTGDIAQMLPDGTLRIIDRKKHIFKLAQGEYVAPEKIENVYIRTPCVQQVFVDGNSFERCLVAIVVPDEDNLKRWWQKNFQTNGTTYEQALQSKEVRKYVLEELLKIGKENRLNSLEQVKAVHLTNEAFSVENGLLTPTLKAKRPQLRAFYANVIADLYKAINEEC